MNRNTGIEIFKPGMEISIEIEKFKPGLKFSIGIEVFRSQGPLGFRSLVISDSRFESQPAIAPNRALWSTLRL